MSRSARRSPFLPPSSTLLSPDALARLNDGQRRFVCSDAELVLGAILRVEVFASAGKSAACEAFIR